VRPFPASPSHHRPGGGYRNPWPGTDAHSFVDFLRWRLVERRTRRLAPNPPRDSLPRREPAIIAPRAMPGYRAATWVGHSTVLLQLGRLNVLTDPIWSERASPLRWIGPRRLMAPAVDFDALPAIDLVLLSHNHYDHLDAATVRRIAGRFPQAAWLCPLGLAPLLPTLGVRHAIERDWWQSVDTPAFCATCAPAQHFSSRGLGDRCATLWCGWSIAADGVRVYFGGDTGCIPSSEPSGRGSGRSISCCCRSAPTSRAGSCAPSTSIRTTLSRPIERSRKAARPHHPAWRCTGAPSA
jgi:N-acyl-phosphatidylethanolamine-hydrolysing phospholipase D